MCIIWLESFSMHIGMAHKRQFSAVNILSKSFSDGDSSTNTGT